MRPALAKSRAMILHLAVEDLIEERVDDSSVSALLHGLSNWNWMIVTNTGFAIGFAIEDALCAVTLD
jgi:hypothetical protein